MRAILRALLQLTTLCLPVHAALADAPVDERAMKAAYLYNFALFARWPSLPDSGFQLCVLGPTSLDEELWRLEGKRVQNGLPLTLRRVAPGEPLAGCQLLYVDERHRRDLDSLLNLLAESPVLTVTDGIGLADRGVMIEMRRQGQRIIFDVNLAAARRARLDFSARLLKLASFVTHNS